MKAMPKNSFRLLAVGALAVPAIAIASPNAHATIHHYPAIGGTCVGSAVLRCLELRYDDDLRRYRAYAEVTDNVNDNIDAWVGIDFVYTNPGSSARGTTTDTKIVVSTPLANCGTGTRVVEFAARFFWGNHATGATASEVRNGSVRIC
jgi:hypothetical protein